MQGQSKERRVPVLLTRPLTASEAFAQSLSARFGDRVLPLLSPLMAPVFLAPDLPPGPFAGVIFTSATGVAAAARFRADLPGVAFCVGAQTAARARAAGFHALSADGDAEALLALLLGGPHPGRLLHLAGEETRGDLAARLVSAGIETHTVAVYRQEPRPLTEAALALLRQDGPVILPLFSPRSARLAHAALPKDLRAALLVAAISPAVADVARDLPHSSLTVADRPDATAILDAIGLLLKTAQADPPP